MPLEEQVAILADFLMDEFGGPNRSEGAIEMAMRLFRERLEVWPKHVEVYVEGQGHQVYVPAQSDWNEQ